MGQVNLAEHMAHEALELTGEQPQTLMLLARINILKDRPKAARIFLNALSKIPFHRSQADAALRHMEADPKWSDDTGLNEVRALMVRNDQADSCLADADLLRQLLQNNPRNRMAYEYMMAHWLLTRQVPMIANNLRALPMLGYTNIPRHYQEAVLLYQARKPDAKIELPLQGIGPETRERFQRYLASRRQLDASPAANREFVQNYYGTFWFYYQLAENQEPARAPNPSVP
jgi:hypothetical protein